MTALLKRDDARAWFRKYGLTYSDLTLGSIQQLQILLSKEMKDSKLMKDSFRMKRKIAYGLGTKGFWIALHCKSFYFEDREAITFNDDGFIGFAGWADESNVQPILKAFHGWVINLSIAKRSQVAA